MPVNESCAEVPERVSKKPEVLLKMIKPDQTIHIQKIAQEVQESAIQTMKLDPEPKAFARKVEPIRAHKLTTPKQELAQKPDTVKPKFTPKPRPVYRTPQKANKSATPEEKPRAKMEAKPKPKHVSSTVRPPKRPVRETKAKVIIRQPEKIAVKQITPPEYKTPEAIKVEQAKPAKKPEQASDIAVNADIRSVEPALRAEVPPETQAERPQQKVTLQKHMEKPQTEQSSEPLILQDTSFENEQPQRVVDMNSVRAPQIIAEFQELITERIESLEETQVAIAENIYTELSDLGQELKTLHKTMERTDVPFHVENELIAKFEEACLEFLQALEIEATPEAINRLMHVIIGSDAVNKITRQQFTNREEKGTHEAKIDYDLSGLALNFGQLFSSDNLGPFVVRIAKAA